MNFAPHISSQSEQMGTLLEKYAAEHVFETVELSRWPSAPYSPVPTPAVATSQCKKRSKKTAISKVAQKIGAPSADICKAASQVGSVLGQPQEDKTPDILGGRGYYAYLNNSAI